MKLKIPLITKQTHLLYLWLYSVHSVSVWVSAFAPNGAEICVLGWPEDTTYGGGIVNSQDWHGGCAGALHTGLQSHDHGGAEWESRWNTVVRGLRFSFYSGRKIKTNTKLLKDFGFGRLPFRAALGSRGWKVRRGRIWGADTVPEKLCTIQRKLRVTGTCHGIGEMTVLPCVSLVGVIFFFYFLFFF